MKRGFKDSCNKRYYEKDRWFVQSAWKYQKVMTKQFFWDVGICFAKNVYAKIFRLNFKKENSASNAKSVINNLIL
jgi:hypothetical protein